MLANTTESLSREPVSKVSVQCWEPANQQRLTELCLTSCYAVLCWHNLSRPVLNGFQTDRLVSSKFRSHTAHTGSETLCGKTPHLVPTSVQSAGKYTVCNCLLLRFLFVCCLSVTKWNMFGVIYDLRVQNFVSRTNISEKTQKTLRKELENF